VFTALANGFGYDEFILLPGVGKAIAWLNQSGFAVVVVTNQSGVARGILRKKHCG